MAFELRARPSENGSVQAPAGRRPPLIILRASLSSGVQTFNLDIEDTEEVVERFLEHTKAVGKGVQGLRAIFGRVREARIEMSKAEHLLSYSLISLITSKPLASSGQSPHIRGTMEDERGRGRSFTDGIRLWLIEWAEIEAQIQGEGMYERRRSMALQKTAETLQVVADLYDDHTTPHPHRSSIILKLLRLEIAFFNTFFRTTPAVDLRTRAIDISALSAQHRG
ncbi:hypothetical protein BDP27DRAFT_1418148 [Rhodocollybia butyracea]|uniref:Uncharacterized protein n=1 Tax=Rhodocollybia butyracea TaxID=206335 RepID=A0A9P5UAN4_9AGAR|nr:hypothetical protein BDP27DRAFT_1418148 [Rhodocollybia butyracea]